MTTTSRGRARLAALVAGTTALTALAAGTAAPTSAEPTEAVPPLGRAADPITGSAGYLAPYFTQGDLTGDDQITQADIDLVAAAIGLTSADAGWAEVAAADLDGDGELTVADLADLAQRVLYDDGPFELLEASALDMQRAMNAGSVTSVELTQAYLDRIAAYDGLVDAAHVRALNSVITTGGEPALEAAAESDRLRIENGGPRSMLDGIPVVFKDNYDTLDMPTSAGHGSWEANQTDTDAFMVDGVRDAGAVVLAKASLDEFALGFASAYTAGVPAGSSKLVASPYELSRTAGGSSGGTGASISANLGAIGFGTDTGGSIRVPASYNQLVGIRPTVGLASRDGIVPLALSQDTGGPMTRTVADAAVALDAVVGVDEADPLTGEQTGLVPDSYTESLDPDALEGARIGYVTSMVGSNATTVRLFEEAVADLEAQGATVVPITTTVLTPTLNEPSGSTNEFKHDLNAYIATHLDPDVSTRTLAAIIASGRLVPGRAGTYSGRDNVTEEAYQTWIASHSAAIATGEQVTTSLLEDNELLALMYPSGNPYGTQGTNLRLSPNTGMPSVTLPMGQATATEAIPGAGVNLELLGRNYSEGDLLALAYAYEQATEHRTTPTLYPALPDQPGTDASTSGRAARAAGFAVEVSDDAVEIGDEVTVTVRGSGLDDVYSYALELGYDPAVLEPVAGSGTTPPTPLTYEDAEAGTVALTGTELGSSPGTTGGSTVATMTFTALATGATQVSADALTTVDSELVTRTATDLGAATVAVDLGAAPVAVEDPTITGLGRVGQVLRTDGGEWDPRGVSLAYQWLSDGEPIAGATAASYRAGVEDHDTALTVQVTATLPGRAAGVATSAPKTVFKAYTAVTGRVTPSPVRAGREPLARIAVTASGATPTGSVVVRYAGSRVGTVDLLDGAATVRLPARPARGFFLRLSYRPSAAFLGSSVRQAVVVR